MNKYTYNEFVNALKAIGLKKGDVVFSHSNVGFFGLPRGYADAKTACQLILDAVFHVIGTEGTLVVPTFTYSFPQKKIYDPDNSPSDCGVFTEIIRKDSASYRSDDPCISVAAIGRYARDLTMDVPENAYGVDSFFDRFYRMNGVICNLNFDAGSTFVHYVERVLNVPYRFDKTFSGVIKKKEDQYDAKSTLWVRYTSSDDTIAKFETFDKLARDSKMYITSPVGRGFVGKITAQDTFDLIKNTLPHRPWFLTQAEIRGNVPELIPERITQ